MLVVRERRWTGTKRHFPAFQQGDRSRRVGSKIPELMNKTLVADIGGTHVKLMVKGAEQRVFDSGAKMQPHDFVANLKEQTADWKEELEQFAEYYQQYLGGKAETMVRNPPLVCTGPITYKGQKALRADIDNLRAAIATQSVTEAFMPSIAPRAIGRNEFYATGEEFLLAIADAMHEEYRTIVDAGFVLQIDDPWLTSLYFDDPFGLGPEQHIDMLNHALIGIPPERVRYHTCYGINEGPRIHDVPLLDIVHRLLRINAEAYSFEAANPRHLHEWHVWEQVKLPPEKMLIPGMISHAYNIVEH